jgi:hypothetical protein
LVPPCTSAPRTRFGFGLAEPYANADEIDLDEDDDMHDAEQHPDQMGNMADRVMSVDAAFQGMYVCYYIPPLPLVSAGWLPRCMAD